MTQENKELLMKDLSARLPYGVKLGFYASATNQTYECVLLGIEPDDDEPVIAKTDAGCFYMLADNVKPYLFPLSSMTEEQTQELESLMEIITIPVWGEILSPTPEYYDWLNKNHFDYRGLIEKGLAIDATGLNIY